MSSSKKERKKERKKENERDTQIEREIKRAEAYVKDFVIYDGNNKNYENILQEEKGKLYLYKTSLNMMENIRITEYLF